MIISYLYHYYKYYVEQPPTPWDSTGMAAHGHHVIFFPADVSGSAYIFPILFLHTVHAASSLTDIFSLSFSILISRTLYLLLSSHHSSLPFLMRAFYAPSAKYPSLPPVPSRLSLISAIPPQTAFLLAPFLSLATRHVSLFVSR